MEWCNTYRGILPRHQFQAILNHKIYLDACQVVGRRILYNGLLGTIDRVRELNSDTPWDAYANAILNVELECEMDSGQIKVLTMADVALAISFHDKHMKIDKRIPVSAPITVKDMERTADLMFEWIVLLPTMNAPTNELKTAESSHVLAVIPPQIDMVSSIIPLGHGTAVPRHARPQIKTKAMEMQVELRKTSALNRSGWKIFGKLENADKHMALLHRRLSLSSIMYGFSVRPRFLRQSCKDHRKQYVKCQCFLPTTELSVHVTALELAMTREVDCVDKSFETIHRYRIPNPSRHMWYLPNSLNRSDGICQCDQIFCSCPF